MSCKLHSFNFQTFASGFLTWQQVVWTWNLILPFNRIGNEGKTIHDSIFLKHLSAFHLMTQHAVNTKWTDLTWEHAVGHSTLK